MKQLIRNKSSGFTLIEMIVVIVILGVLAAGISSFIKFSTQIYTEATTREQLVSSARFAIERLNRDVRNALPNSVRLTNAGECLEFTPIIATTTYTDIPVAPEGARNTINVIEFDNNFAGTTDIDWSVVVYPLNADDVYDDDNNNNNKVFDVSSISLPADVRTITLDNSVLFAEDSPTQRLYFINKKASVKYCLQNNGLSRNDILMAQDINTTSSAFDISPPTLQRNAMVQVHFQFEKNNETVTFNNEIQVLNVP
ncbi:MAG: MSHA biogenesis protein MshO [Colwellia sp.]|jgi:MSHA biogenesis protein MshO